MNHTLPGTTPFGASGRWGPTNGGGDWDTLGSQVRASRAAQATWAAKPLSDRLQVIRRFRHRLAADAERLIPLIQLPQRSSELETLAAEILPLAEACRFLGCSAESVGCFLVYLCIEKGFSRHTSGVRWRGAPGHYWSGA